MKRIFSVLALALSTVSVQAQDGPKAHHEFGLMAGVSNYYGDLQESLTPKRNYNPVGGLFYKYFPNPRLGFRMGVAFTKLEAADSLSDIPVFKGRNLSFGTNLFEFHVGGEFNFLPITRERFKITPYVFGGVAIMHTNPYAFDSSNNKVFLRPLSTEGQGLGRYPDRKEYNLVNVSFPFGGGLKFLVGNTLMITTELGVRYTTTDYIDDVSKSYVSLDTLRAYRGQQAADFAFRGDEIPAFSTEGGGNYPEYQYQRGNNKANDWYWFGTLGVAIYLDAFGNRSGYKQTACPGSVRRRYLK